uniref:Uncharacterized protein n=1 Tax=Amphimedon queenslandica TaxID=400682 RepID=A0A1X7V3I6_AMPQE
MADKDRTRGDSDRTDASGGDVTAGVTGGKAVDLSSSALEAIADMVVKKLPPSHPLKSTDPLSAGTSTSKGKFTVTHTYALKTHTHMDEGSARSAMWGVPTSV